jgi:hypothetical protein
VTKMSKLSCCCCSQEKFLLLLLLHNAAAAVPTPHSRQHPSSSFLQTNCSCSFCPHTTTHSATLKLLQQQLLHRHRDDCAIPPDWEIAAAAIATPISFFAFFHAPLCIRASFLTRSLASLGAREVTKTTTYIRWRIRNVLLVLYVF